MKKQSVTSSDTPRAYTGFDAAVHQWFLETRPVGRKAERYGPVLG
jgi:hypothetical protein